MSMLLYIVAIILILSFLVVIHELGHLIVAKLVKVRVEEFGIGYPPRAIKLFTFKNILFSLNWIPFGGFVKMEGEDPAEQKQATQPIAHAKRKLASIKVTDGKLAFSAEGPFFEKSAWARLAVILAGATVNFVFGAVAFGVVFMMIGLPLNEPRVGSVIPESPAALAQLPPNVTIKSLKFDTSEVQTKSTEEVISTIQAHRGEYVDVLTTGVCRGQSCDATEHIYPLYIRTEAETPPGEGAIGVVFDSTVHLPPVEMFFRSLGAGFVQAATLAVMTIFALGHLVSNFIMGGVVPQDVSGPVGIVYQSYQFDVLSNGWPMIINYMGLLSVSLATMNILPIPALDGGRAVFIIFEKIFGKHYNQKYESYAHYVGYLFLLLLIVLVTVKDVWSLF